MLRLTFRSKMVMSILLVVLLPSLIFLGGSLIFFPRTLDQQADENIIKIAEGFAGALNSFIAAEQRHTRTLASDAQILKAVETDTFAPVQNKLVQSFGALQGPYENLFVIDSNGNVRVDGAGLVKTDLNLSDRSYFELAKSGLPSISKPLYSRLTGQPVIVFCHPLMDNNKFFGAVGLVLNLSAFEPLADAVRLGQTGYSLVLAVDSLIVTGGENSQVLDVSDSALSGGQDLLQEMASLGAGTESFVMAEGQRIAGFAPVELVGWSVAVTQLHTEYFEPTVHAKKVTFVYTFVLLILSLFLANIAARQLFSPVRQLVRAALAVTHNAPLSSSEREKHDTLNQMIDSLNLTAPPLLTQISEILKDSQRQHEQMFEKDLSIKSSDQMLSAFKESKKQFDEFFENASEGIFKASLAGKFLEINSAFALLLGFESKEELSGLFSYVEEHVFSESVLMQIMEQDVLEISEIELNRKNGEPCWVSCSAALMYDKNGAPVAIKGIFVDISERKMHEFEMLRQNQELERRVKDRTLQLEMTNRELKTTQAKLLQQEKMASIGQLAAGIAHEINTPLGFITSNVNSMRRYLDKIMCFLDLILEIFKNLELHGDGQTDVLQVITEQKKSLKIDFIFEDMDDLIVETQDGTERISRIVRDLKVYAEVDQKAFDYNDLTEIVDSAILTIRDQFPEEIEFQRGDTELPAVWCHKALMVQAFIKILQNAVHAIGEQQGLIRVEAQMTGPFLRISVSDNGCGIDRENLSRIFDPFFTTKEVGQGTGLGLSIVYEIVSRHHGTIDVDSISGEGATFVIDLPAKEDA